jgi:hypothetical protein
MMRSHSEGLTVSVQAVDNANKRLIAYMDATLNNATQEVTALRSKLARTYWIIVVLSIIMFAVGIILLSIPAFAAFTNRIDQLQSVVAAGFGVADLVGLFLFKPVDRLKKLMGDMGQITVALNSFQTQVALRLLQLDINNRESVGRAAEYVQQTAADTISLIQDYFEEQTVARLKKSSQIPASPNNSPRAS